MIEHYYLAASSPDANSLLNWVLSAVLLGGLFFMVKKVLARPSTVGEPATPVHVKMEDHFVTRREFDELRTAQVRDMVKLEGLCARIFDKIDERDASLSAKLEKVADDAYKGRVRVHENINNLRERVAKTEANQD